MKPRATFSSSCSNWRSHFVQGIAGGRDRSAGTEQAQQQRLSFLAIATLIASRQRGRAKLSATGSWDLQVNRCLKKVLIRTPPSGLCCQFPQASVAFLFVRFFFLCGVSPVFTEKFRVRIV